MSAADIHITQWYWWIHVAEFEHGLHEHMSLWDWESCQACLFL